MLFGLRMRSGEVGLASVAPEYFFQSKNGVVFGQAVSSSPTGIPLAIVAFQILDIFLQGVDDGIDLKGDPGYFGLGVNFVVGFGILFRQARGAQDVPIFQHLEFNFITNSIIPIFQIENMGASEPSPTCSLADYHLQQPQRHFALLTKHSNPSQKYILKTFNTTSLQQHQHKYQRYKQYQQKLKDVQELLKLIDVFEEKIDNFCTTTFKTHLIYQYSPISIHSEIAERRRSNRKLGKPNTSTQQMLHFGYQDICNILYSCLSAQWIIKQNLVESLDEEFKRFGTYFLTTKDIVIMEDGAIKVMDPMLLGYESRYSFSQNVNYSPEKLSDFYQADDEKSSMYELGVTMLEICLLSQIKNNVGGHYCEQLIQQKLQQARQVYSSTIDQIVGINVFDIISKMISTDRKERFDLQQTIQYAEEMYEQEYHHSELSLEDRINCTDNKMELRKTNHSSSAKKTSPILKQSNNKNRFGTMSPKISNFTIYQQQNQEQSSMLESLQVQNPINKPNGFNASVGNAGIFKQITLNDSYNYNWCQPQKQNQEQLFTDPELMNTIRRQLREIQRRKKEKLKKSWMMDCSDVLQRKDRHFEEEEEQYSRITNQVYLTE